MGRNGQLRHLKSLINEYQELAAEAEAMSNAWDSDDPCAAAEADPGLQYEKGEELEAKFDEILSVTEKLK